MSQKDLAQKLGIKKNLISNYEKDKSMPKYKVLIQLANVFHVTLDGLMLTDLSKNKPKIKNDIVETFYTDKEHSKSNPIIPVKAQAGYLGKFFKDDIESIQYLELPFFHTYQQKRTFEVEGDSMSPIFEDGDYVACEVVESSHHVKDKHHYIFISYDDGVVLKSVYNDKKRELYQLTSINSKYPPIIRNWSEIKEVWLVKYRITNALII